MRGARSIRIVLDGTLDHWRSVVRGLVAEHVEPERVTWCDGTREQIEPTTAEGGLFDGAPGVGSLVPTAPLEAPALRLPRAFVDRLRVVHCFRSPEMWAVAYRLLFRIVDGERDLLDDPLDPDVVSFHRMEKAIRRDAHKMHAFVRFRRVESAGDRGGERFVAWYEPSHLIVHREADFFRRRFPSMDWSILTPDGCAHWDGAEVSFTSGVPRSDAPLTDELEPYWCTYYASIFNPARVKLKAMTAEMPKKFWHTLPETAQIPELLSAVPARLEEMRQTSRRTADSALPFVPQGVPQGVSVEALREAVSDCEGCELFRDHTRPVLSEGPEGAKLVLLGEQPGDMEERAGRPFVGPAGEVLNAALEVALAGSGLSRADLYLTNTVKHFRHEIDVRPGERGKRRLHKRPTIEHVSRCQPWLDAEMLRVRPEVLVCLGVTAARAVFGPTFRSPLAGEPPVERSSRYALKTVVTFHPAAILRATARAEADRMRDHLIAALALARAGMEGA
ncbi:Uracil DNA glycosylase superfamily protein [Planctomycetes bacterium Poly30]|uniref:Type-4 uracil-DNA glycosylase n=1 Tax=Saltatorellus ferox TaxID=2528018 RepID=A0A518EQF7_9BACT|nr:Uracil DNA glycosylase superfamily protein [Planctomycetes bacterium Poly30]